MATYRQSRNIESSIIDFLVPKFNTDWTGISVVKTFSQVYSINLPSVCIRVGTTSHNKVEIGSNSTKREVQVLIDIFADSDGMRLDIKDYTIVQIKNGMPYYDYIITNGAVTGKTANGRITILSIEDSPIDFDIDKSNLDVHDRYRHLITLQISISKVEV